MKILLSCVGIRDPEATDPKTNKHTEGSVITAVRFLKPDIVYLLPTKKTKIDRIDTEEKATETVEYIKNKISRKIRVFILPLTTNDPTDYQKLSDIMLSNISSIKGTWEDFKPEYHVSVSSGTAQMQAVWLMMDAIGIINAKLWQVKEPRFVENDKPELRTREIKKSNLLGEYLIKPFRQQLRQISSRLENLQSRRLEEQVSQYLQRRYHYSTSEVGYTAPFLKRKEIDVYVRGGVPGKRWVSVCECKLRVTQKSTTKEEIFRFAKKIHLAEMHEREISKSEGESLRFSAQFITNCSKVDEDAFQLAKKEKIELLCAEMPRNWMSRSDWSILKLYKIKPDK